MHYLHQNIRRLGFVLLAIVIACAVGIVRAAPSAQATPMVIGVIGEKNSPTAQGIQIAINRLNAAGPATIAGVTYTLELVTESATTADDVAKAISALKQKNAVTIFGPDDSDLALKSLPALSKAGIPVFLGTTNPDLKLTDLVFRTRASDTYLMAGLADYLVNVQKQSGIVVYQGGESYSGQASAFTFALAERSVQPSAILLQAGATTAAETAQTILEGQPAVIVAFGNTIQISELYPLLRKNGFTGLFATNVADDAEFLAKLTDADRVGIIGATNWAYTSLRKDSIDFVTDYKAAFNVVPNGLAVAAYDNVVAMIIAFRQNGLEANGAVAGLLKFPEVDSIQGTFNAKLGNNDLASDVAIIISAADGSPSIVERYRNKLRIANVDIPPTATLTPPPTATLDGVIGVVTTKTLNIRSGPGKNYDRIGQLKQNDQVKLIGALADFTWYAFTYRGQTAWLQGDLLKVLGDPATLPVLQAPPTPTPVPATPTPIGPPVADITMVSATFNPAVPQPNVPFTMVVTILNQGTLNAGEFAIATSFKPGEIFTSQVVPGLAAGQQTVVNLTATVASTSVETIAIVLDLNNQIDEGVNGEANNKPTVTYRVDRPYLQQGSFALATGAEFDLDGGGNDIRFTGGSLDPLPSAALLQLTTPFTALHFDAVFASLSPVANGANVISGPPGAGTIVGYRTNSGKYGILQVVGISGGALQFNFYTYQ